MATQHPDHAAKPYWHASSFIATQHEAYEAFLCYSDLGIQEYKWDWEGKLVDESVLERLLADHFEYFKQHPIGKDTFLTFRLPNPKVETEFRLGRALMGIATAAGLARQVGLYSPPLFEVILPMTDTAEEMIDIQEAFSELASLKHRLYNHEKQQLKHIEIIPLFEQVSTIINSNEILEQYLRLHKWKFGFVPKYMRPYVARSDPALNSGIVPTILAIKIALSRYNAFAKKHNIALHPVVGVGTLPFRGGISPFTVTQWLKEYQGIRTAIIQSAFRYDFPKKDVVSAIEKLNKQLPKGHAKNIPAEDEHKLLEIIKPFEKAYQQSIPTIAPLVNVVAGFLPKRRERVQHIGLFGYSRGVGKTKLPRAISYTATLYSLGIPPELIGTGRGIRAIGKDIKLVEKYYRNIKLDLLAAGKFLNKPALLELAKKSPQWQEIVEDVRAVEEYLGKKLKPQTQEEKKHFALVTEIHKKLERKANVSKHIEQAAVLRHSMG